MAAAKQPGLEMERLSWIVLVVTRENRVGLRRHKSAAVSPPGSEKGGGATSHQMQEDWEQERSRRQVSL